MHKVELGEKKKMEVLFGYSLCCDKIEMGESPNLPGI